MKTVFFGSSEYLIPTLEILKQRFGLSLIITTEEHGMVAKYAKEKKIPYEFTTKIDEKIIEKIKAENPDLGIIAYFGIIIPKEVLEIFPRGLINIHPSLLPKYRGPTPVQTALLNGDFETGVTIMKTDEKIDHGPILSQEEYQVWENDNASTLHKSLFQLGADLLEKTLVDYLEENLLPWEQDEKLATMTKPLKRDDGKITISNPPDKEKLDRMIRAYFPWPGVWFKTKLNNREVVIKILPDNMLQVEGKKPQSFKDFANGYKEGSEILSKLNLT